MSQDQFLDVIDRDEAERRLSAAISLAPLPAERVPLEAALGRVLAEDVRSEVDVPCFDRSNYDGYAVRAADTYGATEEEPVRLRLLPEVIPTGHVPESEITASSAVTIATGAVLPRGADAVVMVEQTDVESSGDGQDMLVVRRAVHAGFGIAYAGSDIAGGETVLRAGQRLSSRETGVLAAIGRAEVLVHRRPVVAVISTGDEIIEPGRAMQPGLVYDSNARILADAVRECHGEPLMLGTVRDDAELLRAKLHEALRTADVVLLSGGTSKGAGDLSYRVVSELTEPGIVAHGVALKPGKPICLAAHRRKPVVILPGFPTSAVFTFHEFVAPVIRALGGLRSAPRRRVDARLAVKVNSEIGRTEYLLVGLVGPRAHVADGSRAVAFPMGKGSGSVTTFSQADGFITIDRHTEIVPAGTDVEVQLLGRDLASADLVVIGSHCLGLDLLLGRLLRKGYTSRFMAVGSTAGLDALGRGECDVAGMHLLDAATGTYNRPFLNESLVLIPGYKRLQGVVFRRGDDRFEGRDAREAIADAAVWPDCLMANRNQGSGTRMLIDRLLGEARPPGYHFQPRSHHAVAAAVAQHRADWGVAIEPVAQRHGLGFLPLEEEHYDFGVRKDRLHLPAVQAFRQLLDDAQVRSELASMGFPPE